MKLTPWLRSLKTGLSRVFPKAKVKRRSIKSDRPGLMNSGLGAEELEDRALLVATAYVTAVADGVYAKDVLLQTLPASPITLPLDPFGNPGIRFTVYFSSLVSVNVAAGRPEIHFNTFSNDSNAPNYEGLPSAAIYMGPSVTNQPTLDFWYEIKNGQNTPGPLYNDPVLKVVSGSNPGLALTDALGPVNMNAIANGGVIQDASFTLDKFIYIDTTPIVKDVDAIPTATIDSLPYNDDPNAGVIRRPYRVGDPPIEIVVTLSEPVVITGTPTLTLNIINTITNQNAKAVYVSGSGTNKLHYLYTVSPGDNTNDLDVASSAPFGLLNATLKDRDFVPDDPSGYIANSDSGLRTVGPSGVNPGVLGQHRAIQVDTTTPIVGPPVGQTVFTGVTAKNINGTYGTGSVLTLTVQFNEAVVLTGTPTLLLATSPNGGVATFSGLEGGDTLVFTYIVQSGDGTNDLDYLNPNALQLNGGSLTDLAGNAAVLTLPPPGGVGSLSANKDIVLDTTLAVTNVTTTLPNGSYGVGQVIPIQIQFNNGKAVQVIGTPQLVLKLDSPTNSVVVDYSSGSGTNILTFLYTIQDGHNAADLDYLSADALILNGGSIIDAVSGGAADLTLKLPGAQGSLGFNKNINIDSVAPNTSTVSTGVSAPNGTYVAGQIIPITVTFSEPVSVTGTPQIVLETNGVPGVQGPNTIPGVQADAVVNYTSGSGSRTLTFNYTVAPGQNSLDLEAIQLVLANGSLIKDLGGNNLADVASVGNIYPLPQAVSEPLSTVTVTPNTPAVAQIHQLNVGFTVLPGETYNVTINGFGFNYTPIAGDSGVTVAAALRSQINSFFGSTLSVGGSSNQILLTAKTAGVPFTVTGVTVTPIGAPPAFGTFTSTVVRANGVPTSQVDEITVSNPTVGMVIDFTINGTPIRYVSDTTIEADAAEDIKNLINLKLPTAVLATTSGTNVITVTALNSGSPTTISVLHALASLRDIVVDTAPVITDVNSAQTAAGNPYSAADSSVIDIYVTFTEPVYVDTTFGTPRLVLETNGKAFAQTTASGGFAADGFAVYDSNFAPNVLLFKYTVGPNDTSVDLDVAIDALSGKATLQLNGGSIKDKPTGGKVIDPLLKQPGAPGSLSVNQTLQINSIVNDPPVNQVPGPQTVEEDSLTGLVFSTANGNLIQIADVDSTASLTVTLTAGPAGRGTIHLPNVMGLTVTGNDTSEVTLTGSLALINARLDGLTFYPALNDNSLIVPGIQLTVSTNDLGSGPGPLIDTDIIPINVTSVNDVPVAIDQTVTTAVDTSQVIILSVTDPDSLQNQVFTIDPNNLPQHGTLSVISGGNSITYTPNPGYVGPDSFRFSSFDGVVNSNFGVISINVVPVVAFSGFPDVSQQEGDPGISNMIFTVTLSQPAVDAVVINYTLSDGTALANLDYIVPAQLFITINPGESVGTISVPIIGDLDDEPNKTFTVNLTSATNAVLLDTSAVGTIVNDDGLSIEGFTADEGNNGQTAFNFLVSLSSPAATDVTVNYQTVDGTATAAGGDYVAKSGSVTIPMGQTSATITILVNGDTLNEQNEGFTVELSAPVGSSLGQSVATGTITNDDDPPTYSINDVTVDEGSASDIIFANFTVTLSAASGQTVTVNYTTIDSSAFAGSDYVATSGTLTFLPGETSKTIGVRIIGDRLVESDPEVFGVSLTGGTNANPGTTLGNGRIKNDDGLAISNGVISTEGNSGQSFMTFTVTAPQSGGQTVSVDYSTSPGTVNPATPGVDYTPVSGTLVFSGGVTTKTIQVPILGDFLQEGNETFFVTLSNEQNSPVLDGQRQGVGTIPDDDITPTITASSEFLNEGNSGTLSMTFTLTLSGAVGIPVTVDYSTFDITAVGGSDYVPVVGTVTFAPFQTVQTITVPIIGDTLDEFDETFGLHLSNPTNANYTGPDPIGTIIDGDTTPTVVFNNLTINEGQGGQTTATVTVSLSAASGKEVSMNYATVDGTASSVNDPDVIGSNDYIGQTGTLTFQPGVTSQNITITINADLLYERDETFAIALSNFVNAPVGNIQRTVTIVNDDEKPTVVIGDVTQDEGNSGQTAFTFTVSLLQPSALPATVSFSTSSGSAQIGTDFQNTSGTVTFAPGETTQTITVNVIGDSAVENNENFLVNLVNPVDAAFGDFTGVGTITNDDFLPSFQVSDAQIVEGDAGTQELVFTVTRTGSTALTSVISYATSNGTATAGIDYIAIGNSTLTFLPNEPSKEVRVTIKGDLTPESTETFFLNLSSPINGTISRGQGTGTIVNDDNSPPVVTVPFGPLSTTEEVNLVVNGILVSDPDAGGAPISVELKVSNGTLTVRNDVVNGADVNNNGTGTVVLQGTVAEINATLAASNAVVYRGFTDFFGSDALIVTANDLGNSGNNGQNPGTDSKIVVINVAGVNDDPELELEGSGGGAPSSIQSVKGTAVGAFGAPNVLNVSDSDNLNFNGGRITATITQAVSSKDKLSIRNQGTGSGQIGFKRGKITYGGQQIGTVTGGTKGSPLVITLNSRASVEATEALMRNITFSTRRARLSTLPRTISMTLTDGNGGASDAVEAVINVSN